jgi:hypothetical protein
MAASQDKNVEVLRAVAADFVSLYRGVRFPIASQDAFGAVWAARKVEHLHYGRATGRVEHSRDLTAATLHVAAAYIALPLAVSTDAMEFGVWVCYFSYVTQPQPDTAMSAAAVRLRAPLPLGVLEALRVSCNRGVLPAACCSAAATLFDHGGFEAVPGTVHRGVAMMAIVDAHEAVKRPIVETAAAAVYKHSKTEVDELQQLEDAINEYDTAKAGAPL